MFDMVSSDLYFTMDGFVPDDAPIFHGFFGRRGGVSKGIYSALNCGPGSGDDAAHVVENRKRIAAAAGCVPENLLSLYQVHGNICIAVDGAYDPNDRPKADAHVTDKAGIALGILTADCGPVLFYGFKGDGAPVIGAAHAGWGGALRGVLKSTVEEMVRLGAVHDNIVACVGPCIAQVSYEVGEDFAVPFLEESKECEVFFAPSKNAGHLMFDLAGYDAFKLYRAGVRKVFVKELDTYFNEEDFFSYRRTTHRSEQDYGRQISVIMIQP